MIEIRYSPETLALLVQGHAGAGEKGKDLICCAVSVLVQTLAETGRTLGTVEARLEAGNAQVRLHPAPLCWMEAAQRYQAIIDGLRAVARTAPEHVQMQAVHGTYKAEKTE